MDLLEALKDVMYLRNEKEVEKAAATQTACKRLVLGR